jgi:hypothetical protein
MKKLAIFACVMIVGAGAAVAATVNIPFFSDQAFQAFVGLQNVSTSDVTLTVTYFQGASSSSSTAVLASGASLSWRPFDTGAGNGEIQGGVGDSPYSFGSITIESTGAIVGRYVQLSADGATSSFAHNVQITP